MLASSLALLLIVYGAGIARVWCNAGYGRGVRPGEALAFAGGWIAIAVALSPPVNYLNRFMRRGLVGSSRHPEAILQGMLDALPKEPLG